MPVFFIVWIVVLALVSFVWATRHIAISRARSQRILSSDTHPGPPSAAPSVSVLVAAKDEEENIESCIRTFLEQDYPDYEMIVIDDRSADRTPAILRRLVAEYEGRLRVLTVRRLRDGWFGKNNAMREGVAAARGEWLCFADADCRQTSSRTLSMAVSEAASSGADFLSVLPVLEARTFWERIIQPVCAAIMIFWYHPDRVNDPKHPAAYANGAFMLMKRSLYEAIGGHERVRTEVNEDMHMARITKELGLPLRVIPQEGLYLTRMYSSLGQIWRGWSRIFYGCLGSFRRLAAAVAVLVTFSILPWLGLAGAVLGWATAPEGSEEPWRWVALAAALTVALEQTVIARWFRLSHSNPRWSAFYIVGACVGVGLLLNAMLKLKGRASVNWRGTVYRGNRLDKDDQHKQILTTPPPAADEVRAHAS